MDYQEHCQELDTKIRSIQKMEPFGCYTLDGIVNVENWRKQQIRPLFIGKEPHGTGYDQEVWSMANWLNENPKEDACDATPHTWPKTAYISYALQNGFAQYDDMPRIDQDKKIAEAAINHDKEDFQTIKRLMVAYLEKLILIKEEANDEYISKT